MEGFELYIFSFQLFSFDICSLVARLLVACELLLGLGLISGLWRRTVNWLCAAMLGGFSIFLLWRVALGDEGSCHCFGDVLDMNPVQSLVKNAVMGVLLAIGWTAPKRDAAELLASFFSKVRVPVCRIVATIVVSAAVLTVVFAAYPPSFYFRAVNRGHDLSVEKWRPFSDEYGISEGREVVLFLSPLCEHCQHCAAKMKTILDRHDLDTSKMHIVFTTVTDRPEDMEKLIPYFYEQAGIDELGLDTHIITFDLFIPMTDGTMPLVCLFEDAELVKEYSYNTLDESALVDFIGR